MLLHSLAAVLFLLAVLKMQQLVMAGCPLDLSGSNITLVASVCSNQDRGPCCRYINAFVALSIARYANASGKLGVPPELSDICLSFVSRTLEFYGIRSNATVFCGLGKKIPVTLQCKGRTTVKEMLQSPKFEDVVQNCKLPLEDSCRSCLSAGIMYLHRLIGAEDNMTLSTCRDASFAALASQNGNISAGGLANCFFGVDGLSVLPVSTPAPHSPLLAPEASPSSKPAETPAQLVVGIPVKQDHHRYHLTLVPAVGIVVTGVAVLLLIIMVLLIRRKCSKLKATHSQIRTSSKAFPPQPTRKSQEGPSSMFRRFSYKETKKATDNFSTTIGMGGYGTVYKAQFSNGFVAAVKRMSKVSEKGEYEFCREMELLGRLHHRHLVALRGFCVEKHERFLIYEYMENRSLKDHLHSPGKTPLSWHSRIRIAIDVANALDYLHFYCDPPLCHRDIKSSNILLDENFVAKVADFGLAHASRSGSISFETVNTDIWGTPGYMDPEYVVTRELTEKSDVYSYGVLLLELVTARRAIQDNKHLVEWSQQFMLTVSQLPELVDSAISDSFDLDELQILVRIARWCTQREGRARPSIKQVLRLLHEISDPIHSGLLEAGEGEDEGTYGGARTNKGKVYRSEVIYHSGDARCLPSSSSTSRSYCSRSFLLETSSPQSPPGVFPV